MSWERGEGPERSRRQRAPVIAGACLLAVVAVGLAVRQSSAPPPDALPVEEATSESFVEVPPEEVELVGPLTPPIDSERRQHGPLLPVATGLTLSLVTAEGEMAQVDLDSGEEVRARLFGAGQPVRLLPIGAGAVVIVEEGGSHGAAHSVWSPDAGANGLGPALDAYPSATPGRVWLSDQYRFFPESPRGTTLREVASDGVIHAELTLPPGVYVRGAVPGGLLVEAGGELVVFDPATATGRSLGSGRFVAASGEWIARWVCEPTLACRLVVGTVDDPEVESLTPMQAEGLNAVVVSPFGNASLSPDGTRLAYAAAGDDRPSVLDLASGETRRPEGFTPTDQDLAFGRAPFAWSGSWVFAPLQDGVQAWDVETGLVIPIDLDLWTIAAFAVQ